MPWPASIAELETFLAVAELRSFSRAAERLCITQPAVTGRISRLETALGVRLIERTSRRLSLTGDGERLRESTERVLAELQALFSSFGVASHGERPVAVACTGGIAALFMPALVRAFGKAHPDVQVNLLDMSPPAALEAVRHGRTDIAIMAIEDKPQGVAFEPLIDDDCVVVAPIGHPLLARGEATLADVLAWPILMTNQQHTLRHTVERLAQERGINFRRAPESRNASSLFGMFSMVAAGFGLMIQPRTLARLGTAVEVATLEIADVRVPHAYGLVTPSGGVSSSEARAFAAFTRKYAVDVNG